jgi:nucleoside-diphosphate-sugar epimerase
MDSVNDAAIPMTIFVTGATGALGKSLLPQLRAAGHHVRAVARSAEKAAWLAVQGAEPITVDLFDGAAVGRAVAGCQAVAHLATSVPTLTKATRPTNWSQNDRLRAEATPLLVDAAIAAGATRFVMESIGFFYEDGGDRALAETAPVIDNPITAATFAGERAALAFAASGRRAVVLRFGLFYGANARMVDEWLRLARLRMTSLAGAPSGHQPMIHLDDAAASVVAALDAPSGVYNVADDAVSKRELLAAFAAAFGLRRPPRPTPGWLLRLVGGRDVRYLAASQRVSSVKLQAASGWKPRYRSPREGWLQVASARGA